MHVSIRSVIRRIAFVVSCALVALMASTGASAQRLALKTNSLDYFVLSPNLTFEARLSRVLSLQLGVSACPFNFSVADTRLTNFRVEPELRYWFNRPMARHFVALSFTAGGYSFRHGERYFSGDVLAGGFSYGYALVLSDHWNMEAEIGIGVAPVRAYKYKGASNRPDSYNFDKVLPVPVRFGLSFGYVFK